MTKVGSALEAQPSLQGSPCSEAFPAAASLVSFGASIITAAGSKFLAIETHISARHIFGFNSRSAIGLEYGDRQNAVQFLALQRSQRSAHSQNATLRIGFEHMYLKLANRCIGWVWATLAKTAAGLRVDVQIACIARPGVMARPICAKFQLGTRWFRRST